MLGTKRTAESTSSVENMQSERKRPRVEATHPTTEPQIAGPLPRSILGKGVQWSDRVSASLTNGGIVLYDSPQQKRIFLTHNVMLSIACTAGKFIATCTKSFLKNFPQNFGPEARYMYLYPAALIKLLPLIHLVYVYFGTCGLGISTRALRWPLTQIKW